MQNAVSLILKNISMFNKLGKLLKQQKILFSQNEHNLAILCEIPLAILLFSFSFCIFCADKINVTAKNCSVNLVLMHIFFFFIRSNQGLIFTDFLMTVVTIFPEEGIFSNGNINESLPTNMQISKH